MIGCNSYCVHGGICILKEGHDGKHDSDYCQWTDKEAISKEGADELFLRAGDLQGVGPMVEFVLSLQDFFEG